MKTNGRKTISREEKITIGSAQGRKTDKITDLGRKYASKDLDKFMC
jgi:hypothetical protein